MTRISVVTPVWNDPRIRDAIASIRAQTIGAKVEVIVVDAASTGDCAAVISDLRGQIDVLISEPDNGIYDAMNKGIAAATGDVIAILNADDVYADPQYLERAVQAFEQGADAVYGNISMVAPNGKVARHWVAGKTNRMRWRLGWMPPHPSLVVARRIYDAHGSFRLDWGTHADYEFMVRALYVPDAKLHYLDLEAVRMATGGASDTSLATLRAGWQRAWAAWRLNGVRGGLLAATGKPLRKLAQVRPGFLQR